MVSTSTHIPLADYRTIYDVDAVGKAIEMAGNQRNESLTALYEKMYKLGGVRYVIKPSRTDSLEPLYQQCPNFSEVLDDIKKYLALAVSGNEPMHFTPILLLGEPGVGKTHFAKALSRHLGTSFEFVSMSSLTAGWILSGASSQWNNSKPGKVAQSLIEGKYANPVMVLDEVDKAGGDHRYDPLGVLYGLLEQETASHFKDEFVEVNMDASHILWVATANEVRHLPEPILSRMMVYEIPRPDEESARNIAAQLYGEIVAEHNWGFPLEVSDDVLDCMARLQPREMRKILMSALGNAKLAGRDVLIVNDLEVSKPGGHSRRMGF